MHLILVPGLFRALSFSPISSRSGCRPRRSRESLLDEIGRVGE